MSPVAILLLHIVAAVLFTLAMVGVPLRFNAVAGGLLALTVALWLGPALFALF